MIRHDNIIYNRNISVYFIVLFYIFIYNLTVSGKFYAWNAEGGVPYKFGVTVNFIRHTIKLIIINYFRQIMYPVFGTKRYKIQTVRRIIVILQPVQFSVMFLHTEEYQNPPPSARHFLSVAAESCEMYTLSLPSFIVTMKLFGIS